MEFLRKEVARINGRKFVILSARDVFGSTSLAVLTATTKIQGQIVSIRFECASKNCDGFIERMEESLNSLRIENNS